MQMDIVNIIKEVKSGNKTAFKNLVEEYQEYAFRMAFRILSNEEDAKDVVQDSFIKIWKSVNSFDAKLKFTTWMYKIVINCAIDKLRSSKSKNTINIDKVSENLCRIDRTNLDEQIENKELGNIITLISDGLPEKQKLVFVLRDIQGLDSHEVEKILEMTDTSVKSNLYNARQSVRKKLSKLLAYERRTI